MHSLGALPGDPQRFTAENPLPGSQASFERLSGEPFENQVGRVGVEAGEYHLDDVLAGDLAADFGFVLENPAGRGLVLPVSSQLFERLKPPGGGVADLPDVGERSAAGQRHELEFVRGPEFAVSWRLRRTAIGQSARRTVADGRVPNVRGR
jgi:hypothetical protein